MDITKFKELKKEKWTNQQIADYFQVSLSTLKRFINKNNLGTKNKEVSNEDFIKLYNEGKEDIEIAEILGISKTKITKIRKDLNLLSQTDKLRQINQKKFIELYNEGKNDSEIANILGVNNVTIHNWRNSLIKEKSNFEYKRKFDTDLFMELYKKGLTYKDMEPLLQSSDSSIQNYAQSLGLTPNTYNKDIPTYEQEQIFIGSLLGDMCLKIPKDCKHACGDFAHSLAQEQYCRYIENKLHNFCSKGIYKTQYDKRTKKNYYCYYVYLKASKYLTDLYYKFYPNGIKIIPKELLYKLDALGIAIWFMDDGYKSGSTYSISTNCFTLDDLKMVSEFFKNKFNIDTTIHNSSHILRISAKSANDFRNLIKDYIHPDCLYKITTT